MPEKNRKVIKYSTYTVDPKLKGLPKYKKFGDAASAQTRSVEIDPLYNPSGKGKFGSSYAPYNNKATIETIALPDPGALARSAKARKFQEPKIQQSSSPSRSNLLKARGTQSSSVRKLVK
jgi:hypothetical protein